MERYQTPQLFSVAFQIFAINFNSFQCFLFFLACWNFLQFNFSTQLCLPISPASVNPMFQGHTIPGETIFSCQPANLLYLQKNGGQGKESRCSDPCWKERESIAEAAPLVMGLHVCQRKESSPVFAPKVPAGWDPPTHATVGISHISQGSCAGKARSPHNSGETKVWVSLQKKLNSFQTKSIQTFVTAY